MKTRYLIIGNSAGGIGAAEAIREVDAWGPITICSDEPFPAYSRPLISKYLAGERTVEGVLFRPAGFYEQNDVRALLGRSVVALGLDTHRAELDGGEGIEWERLLLATGGVPIVPRMEGGEKRGVFTFMSLGDAQAVSAFLEGVQRAVVIGGGLIGVSAAEALVKCGVEVAIVEMKERVLNTVLDERASALVAGALGSAGVRVVAGRIVSRVAGGESVEAVELDSGEVIPCDMVVVAIGVLPRTGLVASTDIEVDRGIVVDRQMATSQPHVYACGDCAQAYDFVHGTNRLTPLWPTAYIGGRTAGYNMAGVGVEYCGGTAMNSLSYFGLDIASAGLASAPDDGCRELCTEGQGCYRKVLVRDGRVVGMVFVGDIERSGIVLSLMREGVAVDGFEEALVAPDFGLAHLPRQLWQPRLAMPPRGPFARAALPAQAG